MKMGWNGKNQRFTLHYNIKNYREANNEMHRELYFVQYELPNEHNRVGHLTKFITSKEPSIFFSINHIQESLAQRDNI